MHGLPPPRHNGDKEGYVILKKNTSRFATKCTQDNIIHEWKKKYCNIEMKKWA